MNSNFDESISLQEYIQYIISVRQGHKQWEKAFSEFKKIECKWRDVYFKTFLNVMKEFDGKIQLVFWESCPKDEDNYAFDNLSELLENRGKYLTKLCDEANIYQDKKAYKKTPDTKKLNYSSTKQDAIQMLTKNGWLVIDLYPTHLKKLNPEKRNNCKLIFRDYSIKKLLQVQSKIKEVNPKVKFHSTILYPKPLGDTFAKTLNSFVLEIKGALGFEEAEKLVFKAY